MRNGDAAALVAPLSKDVGNAHEAAREREEYIQHFPGSWRSVEVQKPGRTLSTTLFCLCAFFRRHC